MQIPGASYIAEKGTIPESLILVSGPSGSGKTLYCRQFFADGILGGRYCIYISSSLINKQFRNQFPKIEKLTLDKNCKFINPYLYTIPANNSRENRSSRSVSNPEPELEDQFITSAEGNVTTEHAYRTLRDDRLALTLTEVHNCITQIRKYENDTELMPQDTIGRDKNLP